MGKRQNEPRSSGVTSMRKLKQKARNTTGTHLQVEENEEIYNNGLREVGERNDYCITSLSNQKNTNYSLHCGLTERTQILFTLLVRHQHHRVRGIGEASSLQSLKLLACRIILEMLLHHRLLNRTGALSKDLGGATTVLQESIQPRLKFSIDGKMAQRATTTLHAIHTRSSAYSPLNSRFRSRRTKITN